MTKVEKDGHNIFLFILTSAPHLYMMESHLTEMPCRWFVSKVVACSVGRSQTVLGIGVVSEQLLIYHM